MLWTTWGTRCDNLGAFCTHDLTTGASDGIESGEAGESVSMRVVAWARRAARTMYFAARLDWAAARMGVEPSAVHRTQAYWDESLAGPLSSYLGGSLIMEVRDELVACLIRHHANTRDVVLDVGCASGQLATALARLPIREYRGIDISAVAIEKAKPRMAALHSAGVRATFEVCDLCRYTLANGAKPDVIVFNEVLYYLSPVQASDQMSRVVSACPKACVVVSMKDDAKSRRVFEEISRHIHWVNAILYQEKGSKLEYVVRRNRERPAYLLAVGGAR